MTIARTSPPAKLNLFLEIPARRNDGFHEIDTVMVAIDWRDELEIESIPEPGIELTACWLPSLESVAADLGLDSSDGQIPDLLRIPIDDANLVTKALRAFCDRYDRSSGYRVRLAKRIPAGAGMGGASSDAAHAISCAAYLHYIDTGIRVDSKSLCEVASSIGSDVPFFLAGRDGESAGFSVAQARGRGELLSPVLTGTDLHVVVAFPPISLSTAAVYGQLKVPQTSHTSFSFRTAFEQNDRQTMSSLMMNRLSEPALEILPQLGDLMESLWQSGLQPCQLTGSGSACFGIARDAKHAQEVVGRLRIELQPGVLLQAAQMVSAAAPIDIQPS